MAKRAGASKMGGARLNGQLRDYDPGQPNYDADHRGASKVALNGSFPAGATKQQIQTGDPFPGLLMRPGVSFVPPPGGGQGALKQPWGVKALPRKGKAWGTVPKGGNQA